VGGVRLSGRRSFDRTQEARREQDAFAPPLRRKVVRFESLQLFARQGAADVSVHQIVFHDAQVGHKLVVGDARLVHALGFLVGKLPQQVAHELSICALRTIY
jgi:hypothetical protein